MNFSWWYFFSEDNALVGISELGKKQEKLVIPNGIKSIGAFGLVRTPSFLNCIKNEGKIGNNFLKEIVIPNSIMSIGEGAFYKAIDLTSITIPNSVIYIRRLAFYGCKSLKSITIPNSVISIDYHAFKGCPPNAQYFVPNEQIKQLLLDSESGIKPSQIIIKGE